MSIGIFIRIQFNNNDRDEYESVLEEFRNECLMSEPGMEEFYIFLDRQDDSAVNLLEIFTDEKAHEEHIRSSQVQRIIETLQEANAVAFLTIGDSLEGDIPKTLN